MGKSFEFHFTVPVVPEGQQVSAEEAEALLLQQLEDRGGACRDTLWELARLYSLTGRQDLALRYTQRLTAGTDNRETLAAGFLGQGQLMEQMADWKAAIAQYERALSLGPTASGTWYLVHNNLGFCLNQIGRYRDAEVYCRAAIEIDPCRANAFKNLGLSLQAQGQLAAAARSFVDAVKANASDPRAAKHLEDLVAKHRAELAAEIPDIDEQLDRSKAAVATAARVIEEHRRAKKS